MLEMKILDINRIKKIVQFERDKIDSSGVPFAGSCEGAAADLFDHLVRSGFRCELIEGTHPSTAPESFNGKVGHHWVQVDDLICDPTREQFFENVELVFPENSMAGKLYTKIGVVEISPEGPPARVNKPSF